MVELTGHSPDGEFSERTVTVSVSGGQEARADFQGTLYRESAVLGEVRAGGAPFRNVTVHLAGPESGSLSPDAEGLFQFGELPRGEYQVVLQGIDHVYYAFPDTARAVSLERADTLQLTFDGTIIPHPPPTPEIATAQAVSHEVVRLTWAGVSRADSYILDLRGEDASWSELPELTSDAREYVHEGLSASTEYSYRLSACNMEGCSDPSGVYEVVTPKAPPPTPSISTVEAVGPHEIELSWAAPGEDVATVHLTRSEDATTWIEVAELDRQVTQFRDQDLSPSTTYAYRLQACHEDGCSSHSESLSATTHELPPGPPQALSASAESGELVVLSWTAGGGGSTSEHRVERSVNSGDWAQVGTAAGEARRHEDHDVAPETTYAYRVSACNDTGCSSPSAERSVTTPEPPPGVPSASKAEALGPHEIKVIWAETGGEATSFEIRRRSGGSWTALTSIDTPATEYLDGALSPLTTYEYQVRACGAGGCSAYSSTMSATTEDVPPSTPTNFAAEATSSSLVKLSWQFAGGNVSSILVERRPDGGSWGELVTLSGTPSVHEDGSVHAASTYTYRVSACNDTGCSSPSAERSVTTPEPPPGVPSAAGAAALGPDEIKVTWAETGGEATSFQIRRRSGGSWAALTSIDAPATEYLDGSLSPLTTYEYQVRACGDSGCSAYSSTMSATTKDVPPSTPTDLAAEATSSSLVSLSWQFAGGNVSSVLVERRPDGGSWGQLVTLSGTPSEHEDNSVQAASTYTYRVSACNDTGCSAPSANAEVTTPDAPPSAPSSLNAEAVGTDRIDLAWTSESNDESSFEVQRLPEGGSWGHLTSVDAGVETYSDTDLPATSTFSYRVRACGAGGCSSFSDTATATTDSPSPETPTGLSATVQAPTQVDLAWNDAGSLATSYEVQRRTGSGSWGNLTEVSSPTTSYSDTSVEQGTTYGFRLRACGTGGCSSFTDEVTASTPEVTLNLSVAGFHVNQVVQTSGGDVPLVAGRDGYLRVFAQANEENLATPTVEARIFHGSSLVQTYNIPAPTGSVPTTVDTGAGGVSWNQVIPSDLITSDLRIEVTVNPDGSVTETDFEDNTYPAESPASMNVVSVPPLDLRIVPVHQSSTGLTGTVFSGLLSDTRDMFPLDVIWDEVAPVYTTSTEPLESDNGNGAWLDLLSEIDALRVAEGTGQHYYGLVQTDYNGGVAGYGFVGRPTSVGWDLTRSASWVLTHELGHNFGRRHAPCPSGISGLDSDYPHPDAEIGHVGRQGTTLYDPSSRRDIMSYCGPRWISDYNYEAIIDFRGTSGAVAAAAGAAREPTLVLWGYVGPDTTVLAPAFEIDTRPVLPTESGPYTLEGLDANGRTLFSLSFAGTETGEEDGTRHFTFALPTGSFADGDLHEIRLREAGRTLATQRAGSADLEAASPLAAAQFTDTQVPDGRTLIRWNPEAHPLLVLRDAATGRIVSLARDGEVWLPAGVGRDVDVIISDGVRSRAERTRMH